MSDTEAADHVHSSGDEVNIAEGREIAVVPSSDPISADYVRHMRELHSAAGFRNGDFMSIDPDREMSLPKGFEGAPTEVEILRAEQRKKQEADDAQRDLAITASARLEALKLAVSVNPTHIVADSHIGIAKRFESYILTGE